MPGPSGEEVSLRKALTEHFDITKPGLDLLERLAEARPDLRALLAPDRKEDLKRWLWGREIIDLLLEPPGLRLRACPTSSVAQNADAPALFHFFQPQGSRREVHLTVGIVRHESHGRARKGVCSTFLADRVASAVPVPIFPQKSASFRLPLAGETPIVMVGPGTGIAPFRAFLDERQASGAKGRNWLFFGEQSAATDFLLSRRTRGDGQQPAT